MGPWCTCGNPPTVWLEKEAVTSEQLIDAAAYVLSIATGLADDEALRIARRLLIARNQPERNQPEGPTHADIRE